MSTATIEFTKEQQRTAIAEACGRYTHSFYCPDCKKNIRYYHPLTKEEERISAKEITGNGSHWSCGAKLETWIPDYLNDLNAMHRAEEVLRKQKYTYALFINWLGKICSENFDRLGVGYTDEDIQSIAFATAEQRAEAFLRTMNLWPE